MKQRIGMKHKLSSLNNVSGIIQLVLLLGIVIFIALGVAISKGIASRNTETPGKFSAQESPSIRLISNPTESPNFSDMAMDWDLFRLDEYGVVISYPPDLFVSRVDSIKPSGAIASYAFVPDKHREFIGLQVPMLTLTIQENPDSSLTDWFYDHATKKKFDDPSVSMKDSPYYYREYTDPKPLLIDGQEGLTFSSRTMSGEIKHVLFINADQSYILDWGSNEYFETSHESTLEAMLSTLHLEK